MHPSAIARNWHGPAMWSLCGSCTSRLLCTDCVLICPIPLWGNRTWVLAGRLFCVVDVVVSSHEGPGGGGAVWLLRSCSLGLQPRALCLAQLFMLVRKLSVIVASGWQCAGLSLLPCALRRTVLQGMHPQWSVPCGVRSCYLASYTISTICCAHFVACSICQQQYSLRLSKGAKVI